MYRERMERPVRTGMEYRTRRSPAERTRLERWEVKTLAKVVHPARGTVVVPHRSNLAALMNAVVQTPMVGRCLGSLVMMAGQI